MLNKNSSVPLYNQLIDAIINDIEAGVYKVDSKLISERELCELYDVSRTTVRLALKELEKLGYIYKVHGRGTFVAKKPEEKQNLVENYSFTDSMLKLDKVPKTIITSFEKIPVNKHLAKMMKLDKEKDVYRLERVRLADEEPMMYESSFLPESNFPELSRKLLEAKPLYGVFEENYNERVRFADEEFSASLLSEKESEMLKIDQNEPCQRIQRLSYNANDEIIEYTRSVARSDKFIYKVRIIK